MHKPPPTWVSWGTESTSAGAAVERAGTAAPHFSKSALSALQALEPLDAQALHPHAPILQTSAKHSPAMNVNCAVTKKDPTKITNKKNPHYVWSAGCTTYSVDGTVC